MCEEREIVKDGVTVDNLKGSDTLRLAAAGWLRERAGDRCCRVHPCESHNAVFSLFSALLSKSWRCSTSRLNGRNSDRRRRIFHSCSASKHHVSSQVFSLSLSRAL